MENKKHIEDEINFSEIVADPVNLTKAIFPFFMILVLGATVFVFYKVEYQSRTMRYPVELMRDTVAVELTTKTSQLLPGIDLAILSNPSDSLMKKGEELYKTTCESCHGAEGLGNGAAGAALNPKPRNFTSADGWKNGRKFNEMYLTLANGIPGSGMVAYEYLPPADRIAMIHFVQKTFMKDVTPMTAAEIAAMDQTYSLVAGGMSPNQIPVVKAKENIKIENNVLVEKANRAVLVEKVSVGDGKAILNKITKNKEKAFYILVANQEWKSSKENLVKLIANTLPANGFCTSSLKLSSNDLTVLHSYLLPIFN